MKFSLQNSCIPKKCNYCKGYTYVYYFVYNNLKDFIKSRRLRLCVKCTDELYPIIYDRKKGKGKSKCLLSSYVS